MSDTAAPRLLIPARHRSDNRLVDYNSLDDIAGKTAAEVTQAQYEFYLAQRIGVKLMQAYPQRQWSVAVNCDVGSVTIACPSLSATKGYVIHMNRRTLHDLQVKAVYAAGEILERFGLSRARAFNPDAVNQLPRDHRDEAVSPDSHATHLVKK